MNNALALGTIVIKELYRRKDFYVLFVLTALLTLLAGSVNFFNDDRIVRYLKEISLLLIWISALVIGIGTAARQIPAERENRTIFPLLAKPVTRGEVVAGKFFGCWFAAGLVLLVFYIFMAVVSGVRESQLPLALYFQALWLHWIFLAVVISIVLLGSVVFTSVPSNATICFIAIAGILLLARHLNKVAVQMAEPAGSLLYALYFALPHLEFYDIRELLIHNLPPVPWGALVLASVYGALYTLFFLLATGLVFRRKSLV